MNPFRTSLCQVVLPLALLAAGQAHAQSAAECPALDKDSGLAWQTLDGPDFTFCKALRDVDGAEVFSVTISDASPFNPDRRDREEKAVIDGHEVRWYRSVIASDPDMQVRETLIELDDGRVAHIALRAASKADLAAALQHAEGIRFQGTQLSSK